MPNDYFQFKQFTVSHRLCAMKVGTDGVLLGAWAPVEQARHILDIGTGSGLIALMLAQRCQAEIDAIDIDRTAYEQALLNFRASAWSHRLRAFHQPLQHHVKERSHCYDLIVSNPPYFTQALKSGNTHRDRARHDDTLPLEQLMPQINRLLTEEGVAAIVYPTEGYPLLAEQAWQYRLYPQKITKVHHRPDKPSKRTLVTFARRHTDYTVDHLFIRNKEQEYTPEYRALCRDFYLAF